MTKKIFLAALFLLAAGAKTHAAVMDALRAAAYDAAAEGGLEQQAKQAGAAFEGGRVPTRPSLTSAGSVPGLLPAPKAGSSDAAPSKEPKAPEDKVPPISETERRNLKLIRAAGIGVAVAGGGILAYSILAMSTGPVGWAAAALFLGGMSAYLAHRRLQGKNDFKHA